MQSAGAAGQPAYLNLDLPLDERVADLLGRLTLDEKISLMTHKTPGVPRLALAAGTFELVG
jgi:beta-glucosidase